MTAQDFILAKLHHLADVAETTTETGTSLEEAIYAKVMSKKFRKQKADEAAITNTKAVIHAAVERNEPLTFYTLFGGNKLWRFDEAPEVDWAELFATMYYANYLKSVAGIYKPGARFMFYSQNISVERLNNVPFTETEQYTKTFKAMFDWLKQYLPTNIEIIYRQHAEEYSNLADYASEIEQIKAKMLSESNGKLPTLNSAQRAATELNVRLRPDKQLTRCGVKKSN